MEQKMSSEAKKLHTNSIVVDGHCDTLMKIENGSLDFGKGPIENSKNLNLGSNVSHIDLPRLKAGGVTTQVMACFVEKKFLPADATNQALRMIDGLYRVLDKHDSSFKLVKTAKEIEVVKEKGINSAMLALEGAESLEGELAILRMFYQLGLRQVGLTWNWRNQAADGLGEARTGGGLTEFGVDMVKEANRLGIILDIAHLAPAGIRDILEISEQPIVDSHCGARGLTDHVRNLDDNQLEAVAKSGGVVCVTFVKDFINSDSEKASIEDVFKHIDYMVKKIGVDHVGIGSDFDGVPGYLPGLEDASKMSDLTAGLLERGYSEKDVASIMGGNYLRVIKTVCG
ncbi:MAG: dipeptidase [Anaerolineaceae bacterium]|nr:dipeptidase [Anaerolineaceae bacterium]